ncbi:MAG: hypothetical protein ACO289_02155 [Prochlorococcaceae cyanobacterium]
MKQESKLVAASGHLFRIVDGRRYWVSTPPEEYLRDALEQVQPAPQPVHRDV